MIKIHPPFMRSPTEVALPNVFQRTAFTLIELLVVVAIIAVLISILLPSLHRARQQAQVAKCGANEKQVGVAIASHLAENRWYPPSYYYPRTATGVVELTPESMVSQQAPSPVEHGYLNWSYYLYGRGQAGDGAFQCPSLEDGGHPRTNPGKEASDWESDQIDDQSRTQAPGTLEDRQVKRVAYTPNAAVMPRNKFTQALSGGPRVNRLVAESEIKRAADVILLAEFHSNWKGAATAEGGRWKSKSHRPVNPFFHIGSGYNEYGTDRPGFRYTPQGDATYGLAPLNVINDTGGLIEGAAGTELNAVGRHHPGGDKLGGTSNFLFCDGSVRRMTVLKTMQNRLWGDKYYSVTGPNDVLDRYGDVLANP
ncbi:MAG: prepilin-type N-terminal cleavage/methylation domain-containing protein [Phycisphaerae bacterium]